MAPRHSPNEKDQKLGDDLASAALAALEAHRRRFMPDATQFGHEVGRTPQKAGEPRHANKVPSPGECGPYRQFNPHTGRYALYRLDRRRLRRHLKGEQAMFAVSQAQKWTLTWRFTVRDAIGFLTGVIDNVDLALALSCYDEEELALSPHRLLALIKADPERSPRRYARLRGDLDGRDPADPRTRFQAAMLDVQGDEYFRCRRLLARHTVPSCTVQDVTEVTLDIDGEKDHPGAVDSSRRMAEAIVAGILAPLGLHCHVETSRNGRGAYVRFRIRWDADDHEGRKRVLLALRDHLRARFPAQFGAHPAHGYPGARFDRVAGLNSWIEVNPGFDEYEYFRNGSWDEDGRSQWRGPTKGEEYEQQKKALGPRADYDPRLEKLLRVHAGDLITMPLYGILTLPADVARERLQAWMDYDRDPRNTIDERRLCEALGLRRPAGTEQAQEGLGIDSNGGPREAGTRSLGLASVPAYGELACPLPRSGKAAAALRSRAGEGDDVYLARRSVLAAYAVRLAGGDRDLAIGYTLYLWGRPGGPNSGRPLHPGRVERARQDVDHWLQDYHAGRHGNSQSPLLEWVRGIRVESVEHIRQCLVRWFGQANLDRLVHSLVQSRVTRSPRSRPHLWPERSLYLHLLAVTYSVMLHVIQATRQQGTGGTGGPVEPGAVPMWIVQEALMKFGCVKSRASRSAAVMVEALRQLHLIVQVRQGSKGACGLYELGNPPACGFLQAAS